MNEDEILEALKKSGYLFESETAKSLTQMGFFVETNQTVRDPLTNKSREIDLLAEYYQRYHQKNKRCASKIKFIFEIKNNIFPLVLLTEYQYTPNLIFEDMLKIAQTIPKGLTYSLDSDFQEKLFPAGEKRTIFTQYCSFQKKKQNDEFMAVHPEELHSGLSKITQYAEEQLLAWNKGFTDEGEKGFYRNFIYLPVILLNNDLFELSIEDDNSTELKSVGVSRLVFNYHFNEEPKSSIVYIVTKGALDFFLDDMIKLEAVILKNMIKQR